MSDQRFGPEYRVRSRSEFQRVFAGKRTLARDELLLIFGHRNGLPHPRLGLSVSRKLGPAVVRNRWKRLVREAFRLNREKLPAGVDLIVIPQKRETPPSLAQVSKSLISVSRRVAKRLPPAEDGEERER